MRVPDTLIHFPVDLSPAGVEHHEYPRFGDAGCAECEIEANRPQRITLKRFPVHFTDDGSGSPPIRVANRFEPQSKPGNWPEHLRP